MSLLEKHIPELEGLLALGKGRADHLLKEKEDATQVSQSTITTLRSELETLASTKEDLSSQLRDKQAQLEDQGKKVTEVTNTLKRYQS